MHSSLADIQWLTLSVRSNLGAWSLLKFDLISGDLIDNIFLIERERKVWTPTATHGQKTCTEAPVFRHPVTTFSHTPTFHHFIIISSLLSIIFR
jgi:hypothetical protein